MTKPQNIIAKISQNVKKKNWVCLVDGCEDIAINSHLIQQNGILNNITENGHLIELKMMDAFKWNSKDAPIVFRKIGVKQALSHKVFCNTHDTNIFQPIEQTNTDFESYLAFLLFSYRAICAEICKKNVNIEFHTRMFNAQSLIGQINKDTIEQIINGNKLGVKDLQALKEYLEAEIETQKDTYTHYVYKYPKMDVYASAVFSATDITYPREDGAMDLKNVYIHILPLSDETLILTGFHNEYTSDEMIDFCKSWEGLETLDLEKKLTTLFATNIENWGLSPSLFDTLSEKNKTDYIKKLMENVNDFGIFKTSDFNLFEQK